MIIVVTGCPDCGRVTVPIVQVLLQVRDVPSLTRYSFRCPSCGAWISRPADWREVHMLRQGCVPERFERVPKEILERRPGPALTVDDLIDLGVELHTTDLIAAHAGRS